jgi:UDP-apiose/xylose synthase
MLKEDVSPCIFGSIEKQRWSYACAKQLIERLVYGELILLFSFLDMD